MKCTLCTREAERATRSGRCRSCQRVRAPSRSTAVHPSTPYALDVGAQRFVAEHPDGANLYEIAEAMGVSAERVRQIQADALRSLQARVKLAGLEPSDLALLGHRRATDAHIERAKQPCASNEAPPVTEDEDASEVARSLARQLDDLERRIELTRTLLDQIEIALQSEVAA